MKTSLLRWTAIAAVTLLACTTAGIRELTYPPDFHYISEGEIRGTMGGLAVRIHALDQQMAQQAPDPEAVVALLTEMQELAGQLNPREHTQHPRINRAAPELRADIDRALAGVRFRPPNYFWAGQLSGSCEYCHVPRHE
ncbi:MAG: hypothetical protein GY723_18515 [bacterium]|nr:hypothetical protein [bacterium]MCP5071578.1 hypothetical protein [bacterium]